MSDTSYPKVIKIKRPCHYCGGSGTETIEVDENYRTKDGFKVNAVGGFMLFAMGHCSECGKYIPPTFGIYDGDPCPLCGESFWRKDNISPTTKKDGGETE